MRTTFLNMLVGSGLIIGFCSGTVRAAEADGDISPLPAEAVTIALPHTKMSAFDLSNVPVIPVENEAQVPSADEVRPHEEQRYSMSTFKSGASTVGWEMAGLVAAMTATRYTDITKGGGSFRFKNEGWFGKNTQSLGMDKLHHAWKTYVIVDVLQSIIERKTGERNNAAYTGAVLGLGLLTYAEILDGFTKRTGFSNEDMVVHVAGAGLSVLRNTVPGLRDKIDFRMEFKPSQDDGRLRLVDQLAQRKYLLAGQLAGFSKLQDTPWRFVELQFGYYGRGFTDAEKLRGEPLRRKLFVGIGFNVQALFSKRPKSTIERLAKGTFDYIQVPYTSIRN